MDQQEGTKQAPDGMLIDGFQRIAALLDVFTVPERSTVVDLGGTVHEFAPVLSGRRLLLATSKVASILRLPAAKEHADGLAEAQRDGGQMAALQYLLGVAGDSEELLEAVEGLFVLVHGHPDPARPGEDCLLNAAIKSCAKAGIEGYGGGTATHPLDLFEIDQVIEALFPFSARVASKLAATLRKATSR